MTRAELYALVWERPVTHVARDFGISDVAVRKICVKHAIPTPPLGHWAKLARGKKVARTPLPPLPQGQADHIALRPHAKESPPPEVAEAQHLAAQEEAHAERRIVVPAERPPKLHPLAAATEKVLRRVKPDDEGFVASEGAGTVSVRIGPASIERVVRLLHALLHAVQDRGHGLSAEGSICIIADEQPLALRIYATKDKATHVPTTAELERQAEEDAWRSRFASTYRSDHKVYRAWDCFPSGRLALELSDPKQRGWKANPIMGRWYDRSRRRVEDYLAEVMTAIKAGGALARHRRAQEAEEARIAQEATERRRQQEIQRRLLARVTDFLVEKADQHAQLVKLENLAAFLQSNRADGAQYAELRTALEFVLVNLRRQLSAAAVNEEIVTSRLLEPPDYW